MSLRAKVSPPTGWPYALYVCHTEPKPQVIIASSYDHARMRIGGVVCDITPLMIIHLIQSVGHTETRKILKSFGDEWVTSEGMVFYRKLNGSG